SGIGPAGHLADMGIEVRHHLPGVGQNLMDHPSVACSAWLPDEARMTRKDARHIHVGARYSSGLHDAPQGDMFIVQVSKSGWHAVGERLGSLLVFVNKSYSTGEVRLASKDWREEPEVEFNLLSDERDLDRLKDAFLRASTINLHPAVARVAGYTFPSSYSEKVRAIGRVTKRNEMISRAVGGVLDMAGGMRGMLIDRLITGGLRLRDLLEDDGALEGFVRATAVGVWHASCTNRMGGDDDPMAVTDEQGRVRGLAGLRVVDASIMPSVPCANTNIPTIMMAERISDTVLSDG
ncbi:MAG: GMC oxidoreductase, partial [Alphaproteobacteria bacterium]|nr:GMC oxidoreductase [Alphaproteobacteria bacterium]